MPSAGNRQRLPHEVGEGNSKGKTKIFKENSNPSIWSNKRLLQGLLGTPSPNLATILKLAGFAPSW